VTGHVDNRPGLDVIGTSLGIKWFHMRAQLGALVLEAKSLRHSSGRSVTAHIKKTYGLSGNRTRVINQFAALVETARQAMLAEKPQ
jgi:hypothetical protein